MVITQNFIAESKAERLTLSLDKSLSWVKMISFGATLVLGAVKDIVVEIGSAMYIQL